MGAYKNLTLDPINFPLEKMRNYTYELHQNGHEYVLILDHGETNFLFSTTFFILVIILFSL